MSSSSWREEAAKRMQKVMKVNEECVKYVGLDKDAIANQVFTALLTLSARTEAPVKLSEIAESIYNTSEKSKQDILRLTMDKTLLKCGIVEKIYFAERDVRYFPSAYRFQEVRRVENSAGQKMDQLIGEVLEVPRKYWPVPKEFYELTALRGGYEDAMSRLEEDRAEGSVDPATYSHVRARLQAEMEVLSKKLMEYEGISDLMTPR